MNSNFKRRLVEKTFLQELLNVIKHKVYKKKEDRFKK